MAYTAVDKSTAHFNTKIFSGTGSSNAVTGVGFQPDLVWFKGRSNNDEPRIMDTVRGLHKTFKPHQAVTEDDDETNGLTAYSTDGVSIGSQSTINTMHGKMVLNAIEDENKMSLEYTNLKRNCYAY